MPLRRTGTPRPLWLRWLLWACAGYGIAATLQLLAIAVLGDRTTWTYSAALLWIWWVLPAIVLLVAALLLRSWWTAAALLVPAVVCAWQLGPCPVNAVTGPGGEGDLRVATYNITHDAPLDGVRALVDAEQPDVLLLQEVSAGRAAELEELLSAYPYRSFGSPAGDGGDVVLSRYPITEVRAVRRLPAAARAADVVTLDVDGRALAVLSVHLASPCLGCPPGSRAATAGDTGEAAQVRVAEARRYAQVVTGLIADGLPVVLAGDLNSSPLNRPLGVLTGAGLVDAWRAVGTSPGLTRGPAPGLARVDVVLVAGLEPVRAATGERGSSTHSPVVADLDWPD